MKLIQKQASIGFWLLLFMLALIISPVAAEEAGEKATENPKPSHYLVATYFHNTFRCATCMHIEEYSAKAIKTNFADELKNGTLVWRVINLDEPENNHFNEDYKLYTKSLIISEINDGKEVRWKNLEKIWTHVRDEEKFEQYVKSEIQDWLKE